MRKLALENLWAYRLRLALTGLAITLGVAFMAGTMVLTDTMGSTFDTLFETANSGADVVLRGPATAEAGVAESRPRIPEQVVADLVAIDGVRAAAGSVKGPTQLVRNDGSVTPLEGMGMVVGTNWVADDGLNPFELAEGRAPSADDEAVIDRATAEAQGWELGDEVVVLAAGQPVELELVGLSTFGELDAIPGMSVVALTDTAAQLHFAQPGRYDSVAVATLDGTDVDALIAEMQGAFGSGTYEILTGEQDTANSQDDFAENVSFVNQMLGAFAFVSLFVGTFIIHNTFSILAAQRTTEAALLRAMGASRYQLLAASVLEASIIGLLAGALGLIAGAGMAIGLKALLGSVGFEIPSGETIIAARTIVWSLAIGVGVTVLSAAAPSLKASRVRPIAALRQVATGDPRSNLLRHLAGLALAAAGISSFTAGVVGEGGNRLGYIALGSVGTVLGVFVLGPVLARPVIRALALPIPTVGGAVARIGRENAVRNPKRSAATAAALMVGVALVGFITILAASTKASVELAIAETLRADYIVESGALQTGGFNRELATELEALDEIGIVSTYRSAPGEVDGRAVVVDSIESTTIEDVFDLQVAEGAITDLVEGTIAIASREAEAHHLELGDEVSVRFADGDARLVVVATYDAMFPDGGYLVDHSTFEANVADQFDKKVIVAIADGVDSTDALAAIRSVLAGYPNAELQDQTQFTAAVTAGVDSILNLTYGLLLLAVLISLIGITNTLALSVHERRREIGLLRAVGMTRGQVRSAVRWESMLIALLGTALGSVLAVASAWGITKALEEYVTEFVVPPAQLAVIACLAAMAGVVAAFGPARRAAKLDVLDALSST